MHCLLQDYIIFFNINMIWKLLHFPLSWKSKGIYFNVQWLHNKFCGFVVWFWSARGGGVARKFVRKFSHQIKRKNWIQSLNMFVWLNNKFLDGRIKLTCQKLEWNITVISDSFSSPFLGHNFPFSTWIFSTCKFIFV